MHNAVFTISVLSVAAFECQRLLIWYRAFRQISIHWASTHTRQMPRTHLYIEQSSQTLDSGGANTLGRTMRSRRPPQPAPTPQPSHTRTVWEIRRTEQQHRIYRRAIIDRNWAASAKSIISGGRRRQVCRRRICKIHRMSTCRKEWSVCFCV